MVNQEYHDKIRFFSKVEKQGEVGCWLWNARLDPDGYGEFSVDSKPVKAHRFSWEIHNGPILDGMLVCHIPPCVNRHCVNPNHLYLGTPQDNMNDKVLAGRQSHVGNKGEQAVNSKLTKDDVEVIRHLFDTKSMSRESIANYFDISCMQVSRIVHRKNWSHI